MKIGKFLLTGILAISILGTSACVQEGGNNGGDGEETQQNQSDTYRLTFILDGGELDEWESYSQYQAGKVLTLPTPTKIGFTFLGWYLTEDFEGERVTEISATDMGNKIFYAKWAQRFSVTLMLNGGTLKDGENITDYTVGTSPVLPIPTKPDYTFKGWYESSDLSGDPVERIPSSATGNQTFYAKWEKNVPAKQTYTVKLVLNGGTLKPGEDVTSYTEGTKVTLPIPEKADNDFGGWFEDKDFGGSRVTEISATEKGDKTYYAQWIELEPAWGISSYGGYEEGAYIEAELLEGTTLSDYSVQYRLKNGASDWTKLDSQLIRLYGNTLRADVVGLKTGEYEIMLSANDEHADATVMVNPYDRSGYAHFGHERDGVGGYNSDGTPKEGAQIIYVTEETKNTVKANINGSAYTGIAKILAQANKLNGTPLIVRIIGAVGAATWKPIVYNDASSYTNVLGANGKVLPQKNTSQADLISGGYNSLDTSVYYELNGLVSQAKWDSSKKEFDSYWNNCEISRASNITIEGIGTDARIFQWGFTWKSCNSIEVRNLTFEDYTEDACSFEGGENATSVENFDSRYLWVHHNTFLEGKNYWDICPEQDKREGDGATDFKKNANITISYNHYYMNHKTGLIGGGDTHMTANVTFHHNWYEDCKSRLPLARQANMHMYNNFYDGSTGTNMSLRANAYAFIENCYFLNANEPITTKVDEKNGNGYAKVFNCVFKGKTIGSLVKNVTVVSDRIARVSNSNVFGQNFDTDPNLFYYDSTLEITAVTEMLNTEDVPSVIPDVAGTHKNGK